MNDFVRRVFWSTGIFGAVCALLYLLVVDVWVVPPDRVLATSVLPTLAPGDKLLVHRGKTPRFAELARCASPTAPGQWVVGRVFGVPGDRVEVTDGHVLTNGAAIEVRHACDAVTVAHPVTQNLLTLGCRVAETRPFSFSYLNAPELRSGTHVTVVEAGKVFLVSDNRLLHQDSRDFGQIEAATCEHVVLRLWGERFTDASRRLNVVW